MHNIYITFLICKKHLKDKSNDKAFIVPKTTLKSLYALT